jgi:hypothetical protein
MELPLTGRCSFNSARIAIKLDAVSPGKCQFFLYCFSAPSENFLPKELSQKFTPIPGGGHATSRVELFMLMVQLSMSRSTQAFSRATALAM